MSRLLAATALAGLILGAGGCGKSGPKIYDVSGTVKYEGQDISEGDIIFFPEDKSVGPEAGKIKDGKYTAKAREGKNKVYIQASRTVPGKKGPMGEDFVETYIPKKYNDDSTLNADVGSGKTEHTFDLKK
jgi:hypothetical protein